MMPQFLHSDSRIINAARFAMAAHEGQVRKYTNQPYFHHPKRVAGSYMLHPEAVEDGVVASWLHDTIEDTKVTKEDIEKVFGQRVADWVYWLTNMSKHPNIAPLSRATRKEIDLYWLKLAPRQVRIIKLYDRIDNLKDMKSCDDSDFLKVYAVESLLLAQGIGHTDLKLKEELISLILTKV